MVVLLASDGRRSSPCHGRSNESLVSVRAESGRNGGDDVFSSRSSKKLRAGGSIAVDGITDGSVVQGATCASGAEGGSLDIEGTLPLG